MSKKVNDTKTKIQSQQIDSEVHRALEKYGLSDNEIAVYVTALYTRKNSPYALAKATGIPRTTVYDVITDLSVKGLVQLEKGSGLGKQQMKIIPINPERLREKIRSKHAELYGLEVDIVEVLPKLQEAYVPHAQNSNFEFFPGIQGARAMYSAEDQESIDLPRYVFDNLLSTEIVPSNALTPAAQGEDEIRTDRNPVKELVQMNEWCKHVISYQYKQNPLLFTTREYRYLESPLFNLHERITLFGNRVYVAHASGDEAWGMRIRSEGYYKTMYSLFAVLWEQATPITEEMIISWGTNKFLEAEILKKKLSKRMEGNGRE